MAFHSLEPTIRDTDMVVPHSEWKQRGNRYIRLLDPAESILDDAEQKSNGQYSISALIGFTNKTHLTRKDYERAWKNLRLYQPSIAVEMHTIDNQRHFVYPVPDSDVEMLQWMNASLVFATTSSSSVDIQPEQLLSESLNRKLESPYRARLVIGENCLVLKISHSLADVTGCHDVLRRYVQLLVEPNLTFAARRSEVARLLSSTRHCLETQHGLFTSEQLAMGKQIGEENATLLAKKVFTMPYRKDYMQREHKSHLIVLGFDNATTSRITARAHHDSVSVTSVVIAAKMLAMKKLFAKGDEEGFLTQVAFDCRRFFPGEMKTGCSSLVGFLYCPLTDLTREEGADPISILSRHFATQLKDLVAIPNAAWQLAASQKAAAPALSMSSSESSNPRL